MAFSTHVFKKIEKIVGKANCSIAKEDLLCYSYDATSTVFYPDAVVFPKNVAHISSILKIANQYKFGITPRGAGSGMTGGSLPRNLIALAIRF